MRSPRVQHGHALGPVAAQRGQHQLTLGVGVAGGAELAVGPAQHVFCGAAPDPGLGRRDGGPPRRRHRPGSVLGGGSGAPPVVPGRPPGCGPAGCGPLGVPGRPGGCGPLGRPSGCGPAGAQPSGTVARTRLVGPVTITSRAVAAGCSGGVRYILIIPLVGKAAPQLMPLTRCQRPVESRARQDREGSSGLLAGPVPCTSQTWSGGSQPLAMTCSVAPSRDDRNPASANRAPPISGSPAASGAVASGPSCRGPSVSRLIQAGGRARDGTGPPGPRSSPSRQPSPASRSTAGSRSE